MNAEINATPSRHSDNPMIENLQEVLNTWRETGKEPRITGVLSSGEYAALCIAVGEERLLQSPIRSLLALEDSLQRWVLTERGMSSCIGRELGGSVR